MRKLNYESCIMKWLFEFYIVDYMRIIGFFWILFGLQVNLGGGRDNR